MLSTQYRLRLELICKRIVNGDPLQLADRIWATKLGAANRTAATMLRRAERSACNPDMPAGGLDEFLNALDIGGVGSEAQGIKGFKSPDEIVDFFKRDEPEDWRQRD